MAAERLKPALNRFPSPCPVPARARVDLTALPRPPYAWVWLRWPSGDLIPGNPPAGRWPFTTTKQFMQDVMRAGDVPPISEHDPPGRYELLWGTSVLDDEPVQTYRELGIEDNSELTLLFVPCSALTPESSRGSSRSTE